MCCSARRRGHRGNLEAKYPELVFVPATAGAKWGKFAKSRLGCALVESARRPGSQAGERALRALKLAAIRNALIGHPCHRVSAYRDCTSALTSVLVKRLNDCGGSFTVVKVMHREEEP